MDRLRARVYLVFGNLAIPSTRHVRTGRRSGAARLRCGAAGSATSPMRRLAATILLTELLAGGDPLAEVQREAEAGLDFARQARFGLVVGSSPRNSG